VVCTTGGSWDPSRYIFSRATAGARALEIGVAAGEAFSVAQPDVLSSFTMGTVSQGGAAAFTSTRVSVVDSALV
jgi:hypothetical protein